MRPRKPHGTHNRIELSTLAKGDRIEISTAHSKYLFFVEFPDLSIGVAQGGVIPSPSRVRLTPEGTASGEAPTRPLAVGERVQFEILDPSGRALRRFLTSPLSALSLRKRSHVAA